MSSTVNNTTNYFQCPINFSLNIIEKNAVQQANPNYIIFNCNSVHQEDIPLNQPKHSNQHKIGGEIVSHSHSSSSRCSSSSFSSNSSQEDSVELEIEPGQDVFKLYSDNVIKEKYKPDKLQSDTVRLS